MPTPSTTDEFLDLARKSGVMDEPRLDAYLQEQRTAGTLPEAPLALANALIRDGLLTRFQAELLMSGKSRGFQLSGKYNLLERLGSGGMGSVFLCEHIIMRRRVAIKVLPAAYAEDPASVERFHREARAVATLDHPNIVRAHDVDQEGKRHFLIMEYVDGASFHEVVRRGGPLDVARAANYIRQAAIGLEHAHEHGLVHRDIKPGNLLVDRRGTVKILDMGLAFFFHDAGDNLTKQHDTNAVLGTADYLAPEQAMDSRVDIRADIYSLGMTFYFLLAGKSPFQEGSVAQKLIWHQARQPTPVRQLREDVPEALAAILDRMIAKDPAQRYQTPAEVVDALAPWTTTPVGPPPLEEMPKLCPAARGTGLAKESRTMSGASPGVSLSGAMSTIRNMGPETTGPRPQGPATMMGNSAPSTPAPAADKASPSSTGSGTQVLTDKKPRAGGSKAAGKEARSAASRTRKAKDKPAAASRWQRTPAWAIILGAVVIAGVTACALFFWKFFLPQNVPPAPLPPASPAAPKPPAPAVKPPAKAKPPSFKPLGPAGKVGEIRRFEGHTGKGVERVAFAPNGLQIASAGADQTVRLWDATNGHQLDINYGHTDIVHYVAFTPDGRRLISSGDRTVRLWDIASRKQVQTYKGHTDHVWCAVPTPDGKRILSGSADKTCRLWDVATGHQIQLFTGHTGAVISVAVSPDGHRALSASRDNTVRLWDMDTGHEIRRFPEKAANTVVFAPTGEQALAAGADKDVHLWDLSTGKVIRHFTGHAAGIYIVAFSPDGQWAVSGSADKTAIVWDVATAKEVYRFTGHKTPVTGVAFATHGPYVVSCSQDNSIILWAFP